MTANQIIPDTATHYHTISIDGFDIFYREAGMRGQPVLLLLHGFPASSHMFRNLIPSLAQQYHVIAPDYPGFGYSAMPDRSQFNYSFDNFADLIQKLLTHLAVEKYAIYVFDYGAPVGFRLFQRHPDRITAIISQNGNAYEDGIAGFWDPIKAYWNSRGESEREAIRWLTSGTATHWQYYNGVPENLKIKINPDGWRHDQSLMDRAGNADIQLDLFYDYRTNLPLYSQWQKAFREYQPPLLAVWGKNDEIFVAPGAEAFQRDVRNAEIHLLDTGHFALETHCHEIGQLVSGFMERVKVS